MTTTPTLKPRPARGEDATLIDLSTFLADTDNFPNVAPTTVYGYRVGCRRLFDPDIIDPTTRIDQIDLDALAAQFAAANAHLKPATIRIYVKSARLAIEALRDRRTPPDIAHGTVEHLVAFLTDARARGTMQYITASNNITAVRRLLRDLPDLAGQYVTTLDLDQIATRFAALNATLKPITIRAYINRLHQTITAYAASPTDPSPPIPARRTSPTPAATARPATASSPSADHLSIPLPGARSVSLRTPPDLTAQEAAATGALLRLSHPGLFAPAAPADLPAPPDPGTWTLVFWPENAPDEPECAHLSGATFRRALADYIRTRQPHLAHTNDDAAIDDWFSTEVFVALALDGHHAARDAGTLL